MTTHDPRPLDGAGGQGPSRGWRLGRLRGRFVVAISLLIALVLSSLAVVLAFTSRRDLRQDIEQRGESHAALAVGPVCDAFETYYTSGYTKFRELVTDVAALNPDLAGLAIYDTTGRRLFTSQEFVREVFNPGDQPLEVASEERLLQAVKGLEVVSWRTRPDGASETFVIVVPYVEEWGRHRYSVVFEISYDSLYAATRAAADRLMWFTAGSMLLGIAIAMLLARQSLGPLEQLITGARELGEGHLDRRLELRTGDEFEVLAQTFNHMAARLSSSIDDLEASNRALQQTNVELKELDRFRSDLLANVSHELRTPLTSLKGYTEAMSEELLGPVSDAQREALEVGERNIDRLLGLIDELLSFARFESRTVRLEPKEMDLESVAEQVVGSSRASRGPELDLVVVTEDELPPVFADPYRIAQVLENLLTNAIKFTPVGGRIELDLKRQGGEVMVRVSDSGIGIAADQQSRIFERFYQVESSSTRKYGGIGLGLAIVRQILDAHGCAIEVESRVGEGTTFSFRLPVADERLTGVPGGPRVAIVDDDIGFARQLATSLEELGFTVRIASSCKGALQLVRELEPQAVVLDRLLPDGDGFDLLTRWRDQELLGEMTVVVVSVRQEEALARRLGAVDHIVKPVEVEVVRDRLMQLIGRGADEPRLVFVPVGDETLVSRVVDSLEASRFVVSRLGAWSELDSSSGLVLLPDAAGGAEQVERRLVEAGLAPSAQVVLVGSVDETTGAAWRDHLDVVMVLEDETAVPTFATWLGERVTWSRTPA